MILGVLRDSLLGYATVGPNTGNILESMRSCFATSAPAPIISFLDILFVLLRDTKKGQCI